MVEQIPSEVREYLSAYSEDDEWLSGNELMSSGVINSLAAMELVAFLEHRYGIAIEDEDLDPENFQSIDGIVALVTRKAPTA